MTDTAPPPPRPLANPVFRALWIATVVSSVKRPKTEAFEA